MKNQSFLGNHSGKMSRNIMAMFKPNQIPHVEISNYLLILIVIVPFNSGNVAYEGEDIQIDARITNASGKSDVKNINAELVQYTFVSSNGNASRTYRKVVSKKTINEGVKKGENRQF